MTEKHLFRLLEVWKQRLGLTNWDIVLVVEPTDTQTSYMECQRSTTYDCAKIIVNPWVLTGKTPDKVLDIPLTDKRIEAKLVHELLHCNMARMSWAATEFIEGQIHRDAYSIYEQAWMAAEENAIEELAQALVKTWPES